MDADGGPLGGRWSYDADNRKLPKDHRAGGTACVAGRHVDVRAAATDRGILAGDRLR